MILRDSNSNTGHRRRGAVAVLTAFMMVALCGFAAFVVDVGMLYVAKADLQRAADSAAMAGVSVFFGEAALSRTPDELRSEAIVRAIQFSLKNPTFRQGTILESADVVVGRQNPDNPGGPLLSTPPFDAVEVTVRKSADSPNGPVPFFFARVFGRQFGEVDAFARAVGSDRLSGFRLVQNWTFVPFTIHETLFTNMGANGTDSYGYEGGVVVPFGDGTPEVRLFPWKTSATENELAKIGEGEDITDGNGNFGTLNVGIGSQGTSFLEYQIRHGITASELQSEFGTDELTFLTPDGLATTYQSTGNPGMSTSIKSVLDERLGDLIAFFVHQTVKKNGSGAVYEITGVRYGRILHVALTGSPANRSLVIQPVAYTGEGVIVDEKAPSTEGQIGRIVLSK